MSVMKKAFNVAFKPHRTLRLVHHSCSLSASNHEIVGVPLTATQAEIKDSYLRKCRELHPDKHPGDKQKHEEFLALNKAYESIYKGENVGDKSESSKSNPGIPKTRVSGPKSPFTKTFSRNLYIILLILPFFYMFFTRKVENVAMEKRLKESRAKLERD